MVVDAVAPSHPVWLIHKENQMNDVGDWKIVEAPDDYHLFPFLRYGVGAAGQICEEGNDWLDSLVVPDTIGLERRMVATLTRGRVTAQAADIDEFTAMLRSEKQK